MSTRPFLGALKTPHHDTHDPLAAFLALVWQKVSNCFGGPRVCYLSVLPTDVYRVSDLLQDSSKVLGTFHPFPQFFLNAYSSLAVVSKLSTLQGSHNISPPCPCQRQPEVNDVYGSRISTTSSSIFLRAFFRASFICRPLSPSPVESDLSSESAHCSSSTSSSHQAPFPSGSQSIPHPFSLPATRYPTPSLSHSPSPSPLPHHPSQNTNKDPQQSSPLP